MTDTTIPDGFERLSRKSPLTEPWEPIYAKKTERAVIVGLRLARPHTNGRGLIHGGLITALADNAMGYSCAQATNWTTSFVTVSLSIDFVGSAEIGQWCSIESDVIETGKTICFAQSLIKADSVVIARASGTFRVVSKPTQTSNPPSPPRDR
ncbi:PaaI family thioesterase [Bradyrhizobium diazoefficiens]|uniref:PaaI family thioesterase n=1 Tax=Bradyrhizobium diazoefficiens TaxID=1355477 RepID=UPI00190BFDB0|nr:PaaI family thioesterase [Bradyrhizobium diazoefficiens]QQO34999.1 PaaI family thioesterase [Bradyrhizobium diazoefficiens]